MKSNEMKPLVAYKVTKGSSDTTLKKGDHIWLSENGDLNLADPNLAGWLTKDEWTRPEICDFEVEIDFGHKVVCLGRRESFVRI